MHFSQFIGVDISKDTLDAAIYPAKDKKMDFLHFDNTTRGLNEMLKWLKSRGIKPSEMVICAEHTGVYTNPLIDFTCDPKIHQNISPFHNIFKKSST